MPAACRVSSCWTGCTSRACGCARTGTWGSTQTPWTTHTQTSARQKGPRTPLTMQHMLHRQLTRQRRHTPHPAMQGTQQRRIHRRRIRPRRHPRTSSQRSMQAYPRSRWRKGSSHSSRQAAMRWRCPSPPLLLLPTHSHSQLSSSSPRRSSSRQRSSRQRSSRQPSSSLPRTCQRCSR